MTQKQNWLLERLLIPAGILPPAVTYSDLHLGKSLRSRIGNLGFEYFLTMDQDYSKINASPIGKKIYALHAPWPSFTPVDSISFSHLRKFVENRIFGVNRISRDFPQMIEKSFEFASKIGASIVTTHITHFDHQKLKEQLTLLSDLQEKYKIKAGIEPEGYYMYKLPQIDTTKFLKIDGNVDWVINPVKLVRAIDKILPKNRLNLTVDSASLINSGLPVINTVKQIFDRVTHLHLANNPVFGPDVTGEINNQENIDFVNFLFEKKYKYYITAEVGPTNGNKKEELLSKIYGASAILGYPILKDTVTKSSQAHIERSCKYLLNNI